MADNLTDVICISNVVTHEEHHNYHRVMDTLEIGKIYKCLYNHRISAAYGHYVHTIVHEDSAIEGDYSHYLFMTLAEWREKQIDSILEEI
jgi:hypothetical protein